MTEFFEGYERTVRWCERIEGPCPFPGSVISRQADTRPCALTYRETTDDA